MKRLFGMTLVVLLALFATAGVSAADVAASVVKITGKAQVQKGADWVTLKVGDVLPAGATVSTGFRSELQLKIGPSTVTVKALSRLTVRDLAQSGSDVKTDLYLKVGKIDAEVNKDEVVKTNAFKVSSPVATASVRGTAFSFDGVHLDVTRGTVDFGDQFGNSARVVLGEQAQASETGGNLATNEDLIVQDSSTQYDAGSDYGYDSWSDDDWSSFFDSFDLDALLDLLDDYDWSSNTHIYIGGIQP